MILSQPAARHQTERFIYQKRQQEQANERLSTKLKQEYYEKEFASWENKGREVAKNKYVKQRLEQLRAQSKNELNQRRARLAQLLDEEHQVCKADIAALEETPEQVREKMVRRVAELKAQKEAERKAYVEAQLERRFRMNADELRKVDQEYHELKTLAERNIQLMEKQKAMEDKYTEEMIYAQLYQIDIKKKELEELDRVRRQKEKEAERNRVLAAQYELNQNKRQYEKQEEEQEKQMLKEAWKLEYERQQELLEQQKQRLLELNRQIFESNEQQKAKKLHEKLVEKQQDKEMVHRIVEKERVLDQLEYQQKLLQKRETQEFMKNQTQRTNEAEVYEKEIERLIAIEDEKQWARKQAQWDKEEQARVKLMYDVYDARASAVDNKKRLRDVEKQEKDYEKDILQQAVQQYEQEIQKKKEEEFQKNKGNQVQILTQVDDKKKRTLQQFSTKQQEEALERERQRQYEAQIQAEKARGRAILDELRKQRPF